MTGPDARRTPEQRRAADAMHAVQDLDGDEQFRKSYRAYTDRIGPSILMTGLGQALAAERAAAGKEAKKPEERAHRRLYQNIEAWLCGPGGVYPQATGEDRDLLQAIVQNGEAEYLKAQIEALAWLTWHKKFCRAYLPRGQGEENTD